MHRFILVFAVLLAGCDADTVGKVPTPAIPTQPPAAAQAMPPTQKPLPTYTPQPTYTIEQPTRTPRPRPTRRPTATPQPTATRRIPTPLPTLPSLPGMERDTAYERQLAEQFQDVGDTQIAFEKVQVTRYDDSLFGPMNYVSFEVSFEVSQRFKQIPLATRKEWATRLMAEVKSHWPGEYVLAKLEHVYKSFDVSADTDCTSTGTVLTDDGWYQRIVYAKVSTSAQLGDEIDCIY